MMQEELVMSPASRDNLYDLLISSSPFASPDHPSSCLTNSGDFVGLYPSIFSPLTGESGGTASSISFSPIALDGEADDDEGDSAVVKRLFLARLALQYRDLTDRYDLCLAHFQEAVNEAESLREENAQLRVLNSQLTKRLGVLSGKQNGPIAAVDPASILGEFRRLRLGGGGDPPYSPKSVLGIQDSGSGRRGAAALPRVEDRVPLPKSISVRSSGYLKLNPGGVAAAPASAVSGSSSNGRVRVSAPIAIGPPRVHPAAVEAEGKLSSPALEKGMEFDVYNQGMFKTELCNKWEECGECPYGDHCQFAHGIGELRPVIRHPRYKTEICRMLLAGELCPYGHRCHFRHTVSPSDRFLLRPN